MREGLWGIVIEFENRLEEGARAPSWDEEDNKNLRTISLALHDDYIHYVYKCKTPKEIENTIETQVG